VQYSIGPLPDGCEPLRLISMISPCGLGRLATADFWSGNHLARAVAVY
jgi:hypothetical protein